MQGSADKAIVELWWDAVRSDELVANGVPTLTQRSSEVTAPLNAITDPPRHPTRRRKKKKKEVSSPNTLLYHMNSNIRTLRRVRTTHAKLSAVAQSLEEGGGIIQPPVPDVAEELDDVLDERPWKPIGVGIDMGEENANDCLHWMGSKVLEHAGFQGMPLTMSAVEVVPYVYFLQAPQRWPWTCFPALLRSIYSMSAGLYGFFAINMGTT